MTRLPGFELATAYPYIGIKATYRRYLVLSTIILAGYVALLAHLKACIALDWADRIAALESVKTMNPTSKARQQGSDLGLGRYEFECNWVVIWNIWIIFSIYWECHHPNWLWTIDYIVFWNHQPGNYQCSLGTPWGSMRGNLRSIFWEPSLPS